MGPFSTALVIKLAETGYGRRTIRDPEKTFEGKMGLRRTEQIRVPERLKPDLPHPSRQPAEHKQNRRHGRERFDALEAQCPQPLFDFGCPQGRPPLRTIRNLVSIWPSSSGGGG